MNKFNAYGESALEFHKEFLNKDYSTLVHNSLKHSIKDKFPEDLSNLITTMDISDSDFRKKLSEYSTCLKSQEELMIEYQDIIDQLEFDTEEFDNSCNVVEETIEISKEYIITEKFLKKFFYVEDDKTFDHLMKRNGVIEKFAMLRLIKIFRDFISEIDSRNISFTVENSPVFFDKERCVYGVYLNFKIPIELLEEDNNIELVKNSIKSIISDADVMFSRKMDA